MGTYSEKSENAGENIVLELKTLHLKYVPAFRYDVKAAVSN